MNRSSRTTLGDRLLIGRPSRAPFQAGTAVPMYLWLTVEGTASRCTFAPSFPGHDGGLVEVRPLRKG